MTNLTNTQIKSIVIFQSYCRTWLTNGLCFFKLIRARYERTGIWCLTEDIPSNDESNTDSYFIDYEDYDCDSDYDDLDLSGEPIYPSWMMTEESIKERNTISAPPPSLEEMRK